MRAKVVHIVDLKITPLFVYGDMGYNVVLQDTSVFSVNACMMSYSIFADITAPKTLSVEPSRRST